MYRRDPASTLLQALPWALNIAIVGFYVAGQFVSVVYYPFMWIHLALVSSMRNITGVEPTPVRS
jgi:uncharacterized protein (DUF983 family)